VNRFVRTRASGVGFVSPAGGQDIFRFADPRALAWTIHLAHSLDSQIRLEAVLPMKKCTYKDG
jgi:hypothetical protein